MLIAARNKIHIQRLKAQLKKKLDMKDLGEAKRSYVWISLETDSQADFGYPKRTTFSRCWRD